MKVAIIHFQPLEKYPPAMNLLHYLAEDTIDVKVWSTVAEDIAEQFKVKGITLNRIKGNNKADSKVTRLLNFLWFNISVLFSLLKYRPTKILYVETLSGLPALLYKYFFSRRVGVLVHYHEYTSPAEYEEGMLSSRLIHRFEKAKIHDFDWVSHTNQERADLFKCDIHKQDITIELLPNYPPRKWGEHQSKVSIASKFPLRMVYVGALCTETMYLKEIADWVEMQEGKVLLDIWSDNISHFATAYLTQSENPWVNLKGSVTYQQLPSVLTNYHVGLILYKGHIPNYVYNAPNKLFEYLVCGLDVLFPQELKGAYQYTCLNQNPRTFMWNFNDLVNLSAFKLLPDTTLANRKLDFVAEEVYCILAEHLKKDIIIT